MNKYVLIEYDFVGPKNIRFNIDEHWNWNFKLVSDKTPDKLAIYKSLKDFLKKMSQNGLYPDFFKFTRVEVLGYDQKERYINKYFKLREEKWKKV